MKRVAILGSGEGTNFSAIVEYSRFRKLEIEFIAISNVENCGFVRRAANIGVPCKILRGEKLNEDLMNILLDFSPHLVLLAGYMKILPASIVNAFRGRILNVHPSLLPAFKGAHAVEDALKYGVKWTGVTVHVVTEELDAGPILAQGVVPVLNDDDKESLLLRIHALEHELYPFVMEKILRGESFEGAFKCER